MWLRREGGGGQRAEVGDWLLKFLSAVVPLLPPKGQRFVHVPVHGDGIPRSAERREVEARPKEAGRPPFINSK